MLESIIQFIGSLDTFWLYVILFFFAFIENVFPPSPSDLVVIIGASLISSTALGFLPVLFITSLGSALGFILMYFVGKYFGHKIQAQNKFKFITKESFEKTGDWFSKYGYKLILVNRFLPGTRSVISFFSGVYRLKIFHTFISASVSAFLWNITIIYLGMLLGNNVTQIDFYLSTYSKIIIALTIIVALIILTRFIIKKRKKGNEK